MPVNVYVAMMIRSGSAEKPYWMALQPTTRLLSFVRYLTNARACACGMTQMILGLSRPLF